MYGHRQRIKDVLKALLIFLFAIFPMIANGSSLLMVREDNCMWCEVWDREIGPIYPKTKEGQFAPLIHVDLAQSIDDSRIENPVVYTPTFVLVENGLEIARIEGYPGEDFFWTLLEEILSKHTEYKDINE